MLSRKPGVWYGFQKPALVLANDVIFLATPGLSKDSGNMETWSRSLLSASQRLFCVYGLRLRCLKLAVSTWTHAVSTWTGSLYMDTGSLYLDSASFFGLEINLKS